nr:hypothetical protein [Tanacetum cinerariifolium]
PGDEQAEADGVDRQLAGGRLAALEAVPAYQSGEDAERHVDQEDPAPVVIVGNVAAEDRAHHRADQRRHRPDAKRGGALVGREHRDQQRL